MWQSSNDSSIEIKGEQLFIICSLNCNIQIFILSLRSPILLNNLCETIFLKFVCLRSIKTWHLLIEHDVPLHEAKKCNSLTCISYCDDILNFKNFLSFWNILRCLYPSSSIGKRANFYSIRCDLKTSYRMSENVQSIPNEVYSTS